MHYFYGGAIKLICIEREDIIMSNIEVILPDNSKISLEDGANGFDLAKTTVSYTHLTLPTMEAV